MNLDHEVYPLLRAVDWFTRCGTEPALAVAPPYERVHDLSTAISSALGDQWLDARTEAQGDLTEFLARCDADAYGHWNELALVSREQLQQAVMPRVNTALVRLGAEALSDSVRLDLNRFALHAAYKRRFRNAPNFFQQLFLIYQAGHLPCGWNGELDTWPSGRFLIY